MPFGFVDKVEENVVDRPSYRSPEVEELPIDPVEGSLEEIAFSWVFGVKEFKKIEHEWLVDVSFCKICVEVWALDETKEKLVDDLKMRPGEFEDRLIFLWIECISSRIDRRGYRTKEVDSKL